MDTVQLIFIGITYFMLQFVGVRYLSGGWYSAAVLTAPLLATMICLGVLGAQLNIAGSGVLTALALPVGIAYLTSIMAIRVLTQLWQQRES